MTSLRVHAREFLRQYGWVGFLRLALQPVTALLTTPVRLVQTFFASRRLILSPWWEFTHYNPHTALNHLFYWTVALNLHRFGRSGVSPLMGMGNTPMTRMFYHTTASLHAYWRCGVAAILIGMFGWAGAHFIWMDGANASWVVVVVLMATCSTTFYANTFGLQNYNALGWLFFPVGLYGMMSGQWLVAAVAWLIVSFASFTVAVLAGLLSLCWALIDMSSSPLAAFVPAGLKLLTHLRPVVFGGDFRGAVGNMMKSIGLTDRRVKYRRTASKSFGPRRIYLTVVYLLFFASLIVCRSEFSLLFGVGVAVYLINSTVFRFADEWSIHMLVLSLGSAIAIEQQETVLLAFYWLAVSPPAVFAIFPSMPGVLDVVPPLRPFSVQAMLVKMNEFLDPVPEGQRVWMAFGSPDGIYERVFDGYRPLLELPFYVASTRKVLFMPDWWAVFDLNEEGAPDLWGRDVASVKSNMERWGADFAVVYQDAGSPLDPVWEREGFRVMGQFSWRDFEPEFSGVRPYLGPTPDWWLLKPEKMPSSRPE